MKNEFEKFKKKILLEHLLKSGLFGLAAGLAVCGAVLIPLFLATENFNVGIGVGIGAGAFVLAFAAVFLPFYLLKKPTDAQIALRVDEDLHTQEKVATMIEFEGQDGLLINKQREDASVKLSAHTTKHIPVKVAALNIPALIFGGSLFAASCFSPMVSKVIHVKKVADPDKVDDETKKITDQIKDLIAKSNGSQDLTEALTKLVDECQAELEGVEVIDDRQAIVDKYKAEVDVAVAKANSSDEYSAALTKVIGEKTDLDEDLKAILTELAEAILAVDTNATYDGLVKLNEYLTDLKDDEFISALNTVVDVLNSAVTEADLSDGNSLKNAITKLTTELSRISKRRKERMDEIANNVDEDSWGVNGLSQKQANAAVDTAFFTAEVEIEKALKQESDNTTLGEQVKELLDQLVDPTKQDGDGDGDGEDGDSEDGDDSKDGDDSEDGDKQDGDSSNKDSDSNKDGDSNQDGNGSSGDSSGQNNDAGNQQGNQKGDGKGGGDGNTEYAGKDKVYTGDGNSSEYGDALDKYQGDAVNDANNGGDSGLSGAIGDYFGDLYGSGTNP